MGGGGGGETRLGGGSGPCSSVGSVLGSLSCALQRRGSLRRDFPLGVNVVSDSIP